MEVGVGGSGLFCVGLVVLLLGFGDLCGLVGFPGFDVSLWVWWLDIAGLWWGWC